MSKVRIYGDTSGYVDIAVPAVAGTRTLNLDKVPQTDTSGNTGIGTDAPFTRAVVGDGSGTEVLTIFSGNNGEGQLRFADGTTGSATYQGRVEYDHSAGKLNLGAGGATPVTIDSSGNVGIGTNSPGQKLHVSSTDNTRILITGGTDKYAELQFENDAQKFAMGVQNDDKFFLYNSTGTSQVLTIDTANKIGIGTQSPDRALHIEGSDFASSTIRLKRTGGGTNNDAGLQFTSAAGANADTGMGGIWFQNSLDGNAYALIRARTDDATGTSGRLDFMTSTSLVDNNTSPSLTIASSGKVGIGEVSPQATLHLDTESSGLPRIRFDHQNANADVFEIGSGVDGQTNAGFSIKDVDANATRLAIDDNGIFMLNKLYSNGSLTGFEHRGTGQTWITMNQATNEGVLYINQTTGGGNADVDSGLVIQGHGTNAASGQSTLLRVEGLNPTHGTKDAFTVTNNGRVGIGTYKPTDKLNIIAGNGGGLLMSTYFSGTVTSGMFLGELGFKGYADGNTTAGADAKIVGMADGNHSGTSAPARLDFYTKDSSIGPGSAPTRRFRIDEQGAAFVHASKNNWSRFVQADDTSVHYRLYGAGSSTTNYDLMRYRRHYWGSGSVHITLFQTYYSTTSQGEYWLSGHGRSNGSYSPNYSIQYQDIYNGPGSGRLSINMPGGAPGNSDAEIVDVSISIPAYVYYLVKIQVSHSTFYPTTTVMGSNNSYALHA